MCSKFMNAKSIYSNIMNLGIHEAISLSVHSKNNGVVKPMPKANNPKSSKTRHLNESSDYFKSSHKQPESRQMTTQTPYTIYHKTIYLIY